MVLSAQKTIAVRWAHQVTKYFANILNQLAADKATKPDNEEHFLFLLGTGVQFVARPAVPPLKSYPRGETLSYLAQVVTALKGEEGVNQSVVAAAAGEHYAHSYYSKSVDVIDGPDTLGNEVGDRLAKALLLALAALAAGKHQLAVSGFSRGGVEAIMLMHELARVRDGLEADLKLADGDLKIRPLAKIIADSKSVPGFALINNASYTYQALTALVGSSSDLGAGRACKQAMLDHLNAMQVKLCVLDPVPGGNFNEVVRIGWEEENFYVPLPDFVTKKLEFVQKHETSHCFSPIIPKGMHYEVLPGCHGTGDGNQYADNGLAVPPTIPNRDLTGIQDLVLRRWYDLMFSGIESTTGLNLEHAQLDAVTHAYLPANEKERNKQLLDNYTAIQKNYPAFEWLSTQNYTGLGQPGPIRLVHFASAINTPVTELDAHGDGQHFSNLQHVKLWMASALKHFNFFEKSLPEQLQWLNANIENAFQSDKKSETTEEWMVSKLLENPNNNSLLQESLSFLVSTVTQEYMQNELSDEDLIDCKARVEDGFNTLKKAAEDTKLSTDRKALAVGVEKSIRLDLSKTIARHHGAVLLSVEQVLAKPVEASLTWLLEVQDSYQKLAKVISQLATLKPWCDESTLSEAWTAMMPDFLKDPSRTSEGNLLFCIKQQQDLLLYRATDILAQLPEALSVKPETMCKEFYLKIHSAAQAGQLKLQAEEMKAKIDTLEAFHTPEEEAASRKIVELSILSETYLKHLEDNQDTSPLHEDKVKLVKQMHEHLQNSSMLASKRLELFKTELNSADQTLTSHRDSAWLRFFRDCLRIFAYVGEIIYYAFSDKTNVKAPQFFKPSHGERFMDEGLQVADSVRLAGG